MKNRIFALIWGLLIILVAPALIASCDQKAEKKDQTEMVAPAAQTQELAFVYSQAPVITTVQGDIPAPAGEAPLDAENPLWLLVSGVANVLLLVITTFFGKYWKRARDVLNAINAGLQDNTLTKNEIRTIVQAWKE